MKKSGFIALVGRSNVGKSTLLNAFVGKKIAAVSPKAQTTRHIIHGVLNSEKGQAVFVDTPGIFHLRGDLLTKKLSHSFQEGISGVDVICYMVDPTRPIGKEEKAVGEFLHGLLLPKILLINKIDESKIPYQRDYEMLGRQFDRVFHISALRGTHIKDLEEYIFSLLPEGEAMYPAGQLTNMSHTLWVAEIIREHVFRLLEKEIPYKVHIEIDEIKEEKKLFSIKGRILTSESRHKGILIGKHGQMLRTIGKATRGELELFLGKKIFLHLEVGVDEEWQKNF